MSSSDSFVQLLPGEQPPAAGLVRLYRVEPSVPDRRPEWVLEAQRESGHLAAEGRWFTRDREALIWYREDKGPEARPVVVFVDVPERMLERLRVSNQPEPARFSRDPENEFFLPASLARMKRRLGAAELIGAPVPRAMHDRGESSVRTARPVMER